MNARNLGFMSSWHMLTRDKGWIKPVLVLTLVGWIPILGQIALLGYGLEWARLTAWGVDSAPKQRGVDYGKVLSTGGRAFMVTFTMGFVLALVLQILFPGSLYVLVTGLSGNNAVSAATAASAGFSVSLLSIVLSALMGSFLQAAALRATLYDSFSAGWRLDRLFQMIGRDFGGFLKTFLITLIGGAIVGAYTLVTALVGVLMVMGGVVGVGAFAGLSGGHMTGWHFALDQLMRIGAGPLLLFLLLIIGLTFVGGVIATAMSLVSMNAMGQWFCRFDVDRWGVSADPLPTDAPRRDGGTGAEARQASPVPPEPTHAPHQEAAQPASPVEPVAPAAFVEPVTPLDAPEGAAPASPVEPAHEIPAAPAAPVAAEPVVPAERSAGHGEVPLAVVDERAAQEAAEAAARSIAEERTRALGAEGDTEYASPETSAGGVVSEPAGSQVVSPIPLGPVTSDDDEGDEHGPMAG